MTGAAWANGLDRKLRDQLAFLVEIDKLKNIVRQSPICDGSRPENVAEHTWHLAMFAVVLQEWASMPVNIARVVQMLLIHDLVEIDTGDVPVFEEQTRASVAKNEQTAADRVFGLLPNEQGALLRELWREFEAAESPDARFAKALDRFQPIVLNMATNGGTWINANVDEAVELRVSASIGSGSPMLWMAAQAAFREAIGLGWLRSASESQYR